MWRFQRGSDPIVLNMYLSDVSMIEVYLESLWEKILSWINLLNFSLKNDSQTVKKIKFLYFYKRLVNLKFFLIAGHQKNEDLVDFFS